MTAVKSVSVVISTYSQKAVNQVIDCIASIRQQSLRPAEIFLVLDPILALLSFYRSRISADVTIIVSDGFGLSKARNAGVRNSKSDIIAFIDDDAIADKDWLKNAVQNYSDPSIVGVGGTITPVWEAKKPEWFPEELNWVMGCSYKGSTRRREAIRNPIGCNMSFRKSVFDKVGYFRSDIGRFGKVLLAGEEPEFSVRVLIKIPNAKILNEPDAVVFHKIGQKKMTFKYLFKRSFFEGISKSMINTSNSTSEKDLSTEHQYLKYLFSVSVTSRLVQIHRVWPLVQLLVLFFSSAAVFAGYAVGKIQGR